MAPLNKSNMHTHPFRQFISRYTPLAEADWQAIAACLVRREVKKGELLLAEGKICRHLYFLEHGLLRFFIWRDGQDISKFFTEAPYTFTSQQSFLQAQPAKENIEVLEDSVLWVMTHEQAHSLLARPAWSTFIRKLVQEVQQYTEEILEALQTQTAESRYAALLAQHDPLLQRLSLRHLASYLGIAPQSLSRIRKKMASAKRT